MSLQEIKVRLLQVLKGKEAWFTAHDNYESTVELVEYDEPAVALEILFTLLDDDNIFVEREVAQELCALAKMMRVEIFPSMVRMADGVNQ